MVGIVLGVKVVSVFLVIRPVLKHEYGGLLCVVLRNWQDRKSPYQVVNTFLAWLGLGVWFVDKLDPAAICVSALIYYFENMHIDIIGVAVSTCLALRPVDVLVTILCHAGIVKGPSNPFVGIKTLWYSLKPRPECYSVVASHSSYIATFES